jgi:sugar lactone lactonase YvrE
MTGAVNRVWRGRVERIFTGLPSLVNERGEATGAHDIGFQGRGNGYVIFGLGSDPANRALLGPAGAILGHLARFTPGGQGSLVADIAAVEAARNPDGFVPDSNPYAVLPLPQGQVVADAGGNTVYGVLHNGAVLTLGVFPARPQAPVPAMQSVPNSVTQGPDGHIYVGELTGFPFPPGGARVYRLVPGAPPEVVLTGFTNIIDLAFGPDGSLFVLQIAANGLRNPPPVSSIIRVWPNGTRSTVAAPGLIAAAGLAVGPDGALYVSNRGTSIGTGEVLRIVP